MLLRVDGVYAQRSDADEFRGCSCEIYELSPVRWNRLRGPWICLLDAFYYHSDGLERPSIASGRVGEFLVSYRPLGTRINLSTAF